MSIRYVLKLEIYDTARESESWKPVYEDAAELHVATLNTVADRFAFGTLSMLLREALAPEGSTVKEREAMTSAKVAVYIEPVE